MPKLVITDDDGVRELPLHSGDTLGRVASNAIQLKVAAASRTHCRFTEENGAWVIEDLGSSNGTLLNGRKTMKAELQDGDLISVGTVSLRFLDVAVDDEDEEDDLGWGSDEISLESHPFLILMGAGREGEVITLAEGRVTVGRKSRHMIQLKDVSVSGEHAAIVCDGGIAVLEDLGSSNGCFVNGRRVEKAELADGDLIRFGTVECRFGVGDPAEAKREAAALIEAQTQELPVEEDEEWEEVDALSVPKGRSWIGNLVGVLLILGLGGGVAYLAMNRGGGGGGTGSQRAGDPWSFELSEVSGDEEEPPELWVKLDAGDPGDYEEAFEEVRSGVRALELRRPGGTPGTTWVSFSRMKAVSAGSGYLASVFAQKVAGAPVPRIEVAWFARQAALEEEEQASPLAVDPIRGRTPGSKDWSELRGLVIAPEGASFARFSVGIEGVGRLLVDDASLERVDTIAAGRTHKAKEFHLSVGPMGTLRVSRIGRVVLDGVGLVFAAAEGTRSQGELWTGGDDRDGALRGQLTNGQELSVALSESGALEFRGSAAAAATGISMRVIPRAEGEGSVTIHHKGIGTRYTSEFKELPADSVTLGSRADRLKLRLSDGEGKAMDFLASVSGGESPRLSLSFQGRERLQLSFQVSFEKEEAAAREALQRALVVALRNEGAAIQILDGIIANFPSPEGVGGQARQNRERLMASGIARLKKLQAEVERRIFFKDLLDVKSLDQSLIEAGARYRGTELAKAFEKAHEHLDSACASLNSLRGDQEAERLFHRGRDYMERKRDALALFIFEQLLRRYPKSEWAEQAEGFAEGLRRRIQQGEGR